MDSKKSKEILIKYQEENSKIYSDYMKLYLETKLLDDKDALISLNELTTSNTLSDITKRAVDLGRSYKKYVEISKAHDDLLYPIM